MRCTAKASSRTNFSDFPPIQQATPTEPKPGGERLETRWRAPLSVCTSLAIVGPRRCPGRLRKSEPASPGGVRGPGAEGAAGVISGPEEGVIFGVL